MLVWFAKTVSIPAMKLIGEAFSWTRLSVGEILLFIIAACIIVRSACAIFLQGLGISLKTFVFSLFRAILILALSAIIIWLPIAGMTRLDKPDTEYDIANLRALCLKLCTDANRQYIYYDADKGRVTERASDAIFKLTGERRAIKVSCWPEWMKFAGIAGICLPWSGEAVIRPDMPFVAAPFVAAHEAAHLIGYGSESEASYIAYASLKLDPGLSYSASCYALYYSLELLKPLDYEYYAYVVSKLDAKVFDDYLILRAFSTPASDTHSDVADVFLRLSGQPGVNSYNQMVNFLLSNTEIR